MAYTTHPHATRRLSDTGWHVLSAIVAVVGVLAAAIGAWIGYGSGEGTITVFGWTWSLVDLSDMWAPLLMMVGGFVAALATGWETLRDWGGDTSRWIVTMELIVAVAGLVALVFGVVLLF